MQRFTNLGRVLKKKAKIYAWLLVGFVPIWAYGLTERFTEPHPILYGLCLSMACVCMVASFWIVIWRWELIEQRRLAWRVRVLLLALSCFMGLAILANLAMPWSE